MAIDNKRLERSLAEFEQILEVMPGDLATLEFLCLGYERLGERDRLERFRSLLAEARRLGDGTCAKSRPAAEAESDELLDARFAGHEAAVLAETALLAWLEFNGAIDKDLSDRVGEQLQGLGVATGEFLISALAVLEAENPAAAEAAALCIADDTHLPPIALEAFDQYLTLARELPERLVRVRGVVPFGKVADETLVALANPLDKDLQQALSAYFGGKCHFYFAPPSSLAIALSRLFPEGRK